MQLDGIWRVHIGPCRRLTCATQYVQQAVVPVISSVFRAAVLRLMPFAVRVDPYLQESAGFRVFIHFLHNSSTTVLTYDTVSASSFAEQASFYSSDKLGMSRHAVTY